MKVVRREDFDLERTFEREFEGIKHYEKVSQDHPGLVDVLHVGRDLEANFYYYVMELADDQSGGGNDQIDPATYKARTLTSDLKQNRSRDIRECIKLGVNLAEALAHLHQAGLTHRDVKPSNIIFVKGEPRLADIGLVARSGQKTYVGTEGYVPPEGPGTSSADLYSLAMVIYEMHTGKDRLEFPELPTNHELPPTVNRDEWRALNTVICRGGAPDPRKRFDTAMAFAKALRQVRPGEFAESGIPAAVERNPLVGRMLFVSSIVGLALTVLVLGVVFWNGMMKGEEITESPPEVEERTVEVVEKAEVAPVTIGEVEDPPETTEEMLQPVPPPPPIVAEVVPMGSIKFDSWPSGATVWHEGEEISRTPGPYHDFPPGEYEFVFRKEGFIDKVVTRSVENGVSALMRTELIKDQRPQPGEAWVNAQSLQFSPLPDGSFVAPVTSHAFSGFLTSTGRPVALGAKGGVVQVADEALKWAFCDWMTMKDRSVGFFDENLYHAPVPRPPGDHDFYCYVMDSFSTLMVSSEPEGAQVYEGDKLLGNTPLKLRRRLGPYHLRLSMAGHEEKPLHGNLTEENLSIPVVLERDRSVIFGERWTNSQNVPMVPVGDMMVGCWEVRLRDFAEFLAMSGSNPGVFSPEFLQTPDDPVVKINRHDAEMFCAWLTEKERAEGWIRSWHQYRLPTDLEWSEMAGLTGEEGATPQDREREISGQFPWGDQWPPVKGTGNYADETGAQMFGKYIIPGYRDGYVQTAPVGSFAANENELFDIGGNVWEWVSDSYNEGVENLGVVRGGGWDSFEREVLLSSFRNSVSPYDRNERYGFRYVLFDTRK